MRETRVYPESVYCKICEEPFKQITNDHLKYKHNITMKEYRAKYPNAVLKSKSAVVFLGQKRPEHAKKLIKQRIKKVCQGCGRYFEVLPFQKHRIFCSADCYICNGNPMDSPSSVKKLSLTQKEYFKDPKAREKISSALKFHWDKLSLEEKEEHLSRIFEGLKKRPTSIEKSLIKLIGRYSLPFKYVGDGYTFIGGKVPDFIDFRNKRIIEVFGDYWHKPVEEEERKGHFSKYGYDCLVLWGHELINLPEEEIVNKISKFTNT